VNFCKFVGDSYPHASVSSRHHGAIQILLLLLYLPIFVGLF